MVLHFDGAGVRKIFFCGSIVERPFKVKARKIPSNFREPSDRQEPDALVSSNLPSSPAQAFRSSFDDGADYAGSGHKELH
jgi:hypothetical protein